MFDSSRDTSEFVREKRILKCFGCGHNFRTTIHHIFVTTLWHNVCLLVKIWIFLLIYLFSKVSKTYGSFSIESGPSVRPGETIVLECKKSDELHEAVYWKDGRVKLTTCLKDGDCYPKRSTIRTHITFATLPSLRAFYMIIHNATTSDFQTYICGDSHTEASCEIKLEEPKLSNPQQRMQNGNGTQNELSGTVNCTCKDELKGSAESECCNNGTRSSSDMPPSQKIERNDEERSQAVLLTFSLVFMSLSIFMNIVCIVFMVNRKRNEKRKHNDQ